MASLHSFHLAIFQKNVQMLDKGFDHSIHG